MSTQNKILVCIDFSDHSLAALKLATQFAKLHDSELLLTYVIEPARSVFSTTQSPEDHDAAVRKAAEARIDKLAAEHLPKGIRWSKLFEHGKPWREIVRAAEAMSVELVFMGTNGIGTVGEIFLGSNAGKVARTAHCPVITVRHSETVREIKKVVIPVNPKFGIREIRAFLKSFVQGFRPDVRLVTIVGEDGKEKEEYTAHLARQKEEIMKLGFTTVSTEVITHDVISTAILDYIEKNKSEIDMVMMETRGRTGIAGFFLGSITEEIISYSPVPVFSLRPDRREDQTGYYHTNLPV